MFAQSQVQKSTENDITDEAALAERYVRPHDPMNVSFVCQKEQANDS